MPCTDQYSCWFHHCQFYPSIKWERPVHMNNSSRLIRWPKPVRFRYTKYKRDYQFKRQIKTSKFQFIYLLLDTLVREQKTHCC
jgi:hypothetical protein